MPRESLNVASQVSSNPSMSLLLLPVVAVVVAGCSSQIRWVGKSRIPTAKVR